MPLFPLSVTINNGGKEDEVLYFRVVVEEDPFEDGRMAYFASVPALPGCHSWAYTKEELLRDIQEAIEGYVETLIQLGKPIPSGPSPTLSASNLSLNVTLNLLPAEEGFS